MQGCWRRAAWGMTKGGAEAGRQETGASEVDICYDLLCATESSETRAKSSLRIHGK